MPSFESVLLENLGEQPKVAELKAHGLDGPILLPEMIIEDICIIRPGIIPTGHRVMGHAHEENHMTIFFAGGAHLRYWRELPSGQFEKLREEEIWGPNASGREFKLPLWRLIKKEIHHEFLALETVYYACFFAFKDPLTGKTITTWNGNKAAAYAKGGPGPEVKEDDLPEQWRKIADVIFNRQHD